jgi:DNA-binding response OmpR family regulator
VADDDADILRFIEVNLQLEGYRVVTARDGADALAKALEVRPDLVLLDVLMPLVDGLGVCERIRAEATLAGVPVILLTANFVSADQATAARAGADALLVKPFDPAVLLAKVRVLLGARRQRPGR